MLNLFNLNAARSLALLTLLIVVTGCSPESDSTESSINKAENTTTAQEAKEVVEKTNAPLSASPDNPNPETQQQIQQYLNELAAKGFGKEKQGVWMQTGDTLLTNHQGTVPLSAASITKVATTLVALETFGPDYQFVTQIGATGPIEDGVLQGDLVIEGGEDPFFIWEEAIALGNTLNEMGIKRVTGNLVVIGKFYMNFATDTLTTGNLLKQGLNSQLWSTEAQTQYRTMPPGTPRPKVAISGSLQILPLPPSNLDPLVRHYSFPMAELLKKMNRYSNNKMSEMLANSVGGAKAVARKAAEAAKVPAAEISLQNGSGLGIDNRISPRAATAMFLAINRYLKPHSMTVADVFAIVGEDEGILDERQLPKLAVVKSGSLDNVSALAGALPTKSQGTVWFTIINGGGENLKGFRSTQESLLQEFINQWEAQQSLPAELTPNPDRMSKASSNEIVKKQS
ncbi:MAG: D-alanyl-D-alanine carboxypeptidase [Merismopedia sp. SIO2A8]|nr:D-alanyl-D-alanine carboxypeptidase [Symploca sp. SIO2B6]NET51200.1 D-alanyl-D-alanine carboxypeptidase [Merismopedia sp. SIO2A8]